MKAGMKGRRTGGRENRQRQFFKPLQEMRRASTEACMVQKESKGNSETFQVVFLERHRIAWP